MAKSEIKIAVISDLHCHSQADIGRAESYFTLEASRTAISRHPIQALIATIKREALTADLVLCPGDISNKASQLGLNHAWGILRNDIVTAFGAVELFCTLGNHDVNSRDKDNSPFELAKGVHPEFPFKQQEANDTYWSRGFYLTEAVKGFQTVVINTTYDHFSTDKAERGTFDGDRIADLDRYLTENARDGISRMALLHHHPTLHSLANFDSEDVLPTGDQLLNVLAKHGTSLVIHGHRHKPSIKRVRASGRDIIVLCAGSFSALLTFIASRTRNVFHHVNIQNKSGKISGTVRTWEFNYGNGWNYATLKSAEFPSTVRFDKSPPNDFAEKVLKYVQLKAKKIYHEKKLTSEFEFLGSLFPEDWNHLSNVLRQEGTYQLLFGDDGGFSGIGLVIK